METTSKTESDDIEANGPEPSPRIPSKPELDIHDEEGAGQDQSVEWKRMSSKQRFIFLLVGLSESNFWFFLVSMIAAIILAAATKDTVPHIRPFFVNDSALWYPSSESTVPYWQVLVVGLCLSLMFYILELVFRDPKKTSKLQGMFLGWMYSLAYYSSAVMAYICVESLKIMVGNLRPDFYDLCLGNGNAGVGSGGGPDIYSNQGITSPSQCTGSTSAPDLLDGRKSFPSGHAATSTVVGAFLCMYMFHMSMRVNSSLVANFIQLAAFGPLIYTGYVCVSRITDNRHHAVDVVGGAVIGLFWSGVLMFRAISDEHRIRSKTKRSARITQQVIES